MPDTSQTSRPEVASELIDIPGTALRVSRVALGTWAMGGWMWGGTDERESVATIRAAFDQGINLIDTAPVYGFEVSEELVGHAVAAAKSRCISRTADGKRTWRPARSGSCGLDFCILFASLISQARPRQPRWPPRRTSQTAGVGKSAAVSENGADDTSSVVRALRGISTQSRRK
jgi:hypothetical protein